MPTTARGGTALTIAASLVLLLLGPVDSAAQLNGQNIKGDAGLKSGSQAPPGAYVVIPLWFYSADAVKNREGDEILTGNLDAALFGAAFNVVMTRRVLGANYGFLVVLPWANNRVQGAEDFDSNPGTGLTDMYIQPISLGWHRPRADFTAAYGLYLPTGRYEDGAENNTGLGMWAQEILLGTTVYLNPQRTVHTATTATFDFQSEKEDSDTKVGNILNLEGGVGADFLGGGLTAGLAYYGTFKLTKDRFDALLPSVLIRGKNRVWGLGPEVSLAIAANKTIYGFVTVRYQWEIGAHTTTEGAAWNILATFPLSPIRIP
jgi:hypothetical protein